MSKTIFDLYITDIQNAAKFFKEFFIGKEVVYKTETNKISVFFNKSNFIHLCGIEYSKGPYLFFNNALEKKISEKDIKFKKDGATQIKLRLLKHIHLIISERVTLSDGATHLHLKFDKSINTKENKNKLAVTLIERDYQYNPISLIDRSKMNDFPHGNEVVEIKSIDLRTGQETILLSK